MLVTAELSDFADLRTLENMYYFMGVVFSKMSGSGSLTNFTSGGDDLKTLA